MKLIMVTKETYSDYLDNSLLADANVQGNGMTMKQHRNQKGRLMAKAVYRDGCDPVFHIMAAD